MTALKTSPVPVRKDVTITRCEMLMLERVLGWVAEGDWNADALRDSISTLPGCGDEEARELLAKVQTARAALEWEQTRVREANAAIRKAAVVIGAFYEQSTEVCVPSPVKIIAQYPGVDDLCICELYDRNSQTGELMRCPNSLAVQVHASSFSKHYRRIDAPKQEG